MTTVSDYLTLIEKTKSPLTYRTYSFALKEFDLVVKDPANIGEGDVINFCNALKDRSEQTEHLYLAALRGYLRHLAAHGQLQIPLEKLNFTIGENVRRQGVRLPRFPKKEIEILLDYVESQRDLYTTDLIHTRNLRDLAFLYVLADTGLRIFEACNLRVKDLGRSTTIIGKGDKEAVIRFSKRSLAALEAYLETRQLVSEDETPESPLFARHDNSAPRVLDPLTTDSGRILVKAWTDKAHAAGVFKKGKPRITPHSFRHYFVTTVLQRTGNLKLAQELARHTNVHTTERYAHLSNEDLDNGYSAIFDTEDK